MTITFKAMIETYMRGCRGNGHPTRIECSPGTFRLILDRVYDPWIDVMASKNRMREVEWYRNVLDGVTPLLFQGAVIEKADIPDNEIRFIHTGNSALNQVLDLAAQ